MTRLFLIEESTDCIDVNKFFEDLENDNIKYEIDYEFEEGMPGILVVVEWED